MANRAHILIVDDDRRIGKMLSTYLSGEGFQVTVAENGAAMRQCLRRDKVDLVLLDLILNGEDGLELAREIRTREGIGVIMVTGRADPVDAVVGLEVGADDYIAKPFHLREVLARTKSVLRRLQPSQAVVQTMKAPTEAIRFDDWTLDLARRELTAPHGMVVPLTTGDFDLLVTFATHPGRVLTRDTLMDLTRGRKWETYDRAIDAQVARLRQKIESEPKRPRLIKSVRGVGYLFTGNIRPAV
jgi:two-component system phosphate regulon response regulator OmpR